MTSTTRATASYQKKKGLISKSYKLPCEVVEEFAEACEEQEKSQAEILTKYMKSITSNAIILTTKHRMYPRD